MTAGDESPIQPTRRPAQAVPIDRYIPEPEPAIQEPQWQRHRVPDDQTVYDGPKRDNLVNTEPSANSLLFQNLLSYAGVALVAIAVTAGAVLVGQLNGPNPIDWRPIIAAALSAVISVLASSQLPKAGREHISHLASQVGTVQAQNALHAVAHAQEDMSERGELP